MNRTLTHLAVAAIAAVLAVALFADGGETADDTNIVAVTTFEDGSPNTWTQADLLAALQLMNRKYHRDCETSSGRVSWHGKLVSQEINTNTLEKVEVYADGARFVFPFEAKNTAQAVSNANARLKTTLVKGVPKALAEARQRREQEKTTTNVVNVVVGPNAQTGGKE